MKRINSDARIALIRGFGRRGLNQHRVWAEFAEREGYGKWDSYWRGLQDKYGKEAALETGEYIFEKVGEVYRLHGGNPSVGQLDSVMSSDAAEIFPPALPDELFAAYVEVAWELLAEPDPAASYNSVGSVVEEPSGAWIDGILEKNGAPCRFSGGKILWIEDQPAGEQPLADLLESWPQIRAELRQVREAFRTAEGSADYNALGSRCERLVKAIGAQVFDPAHVPDGEAAPGPTDSKRQIANYFEAKASGRRNDGVRAMAEGLNIGVHKQVQAVKHGEDADADAAAFLLSSMCCLVDAIAAVRD